MDNSLLAVRVINHKYIVVDWRGIMKNEKMQKMALTGVFAALSYVVFTFLQIKIPLPGGDATSIHLGNAVCVLGALLLGGPLGGLGGALGMTIGDLLDPVYIIYAPKTFVLKFCIGLITGFVAHRIGKISTEADKNKVFKWTLIAAVSGLLFNVIFDPLVGYFYKVLIIGKPAADVTLAWNIAATSTNAVTSTIVSVLVYMALRPALKKSGLFFEI
ncbi:ECF transporter S component [Bacteroides heparinolyticus]|uniref:ECF transporter S component n=2 Tax=Prevotella heparinolytica TaxID=28113 RepID=UPI0035A012E2